MKRYFLLAYVVTISVYGMESTPANISVICEGHEPIELSEKLVKRSGTLANILEDCEVKDSLSLPEDSHKKVSRLKEILETHDHFKKSKSFKKFKLDANIIDEFDVKDLFKDCSTAGDKFIRKFLSPLPDCAMRDYFVPDFSEIKKSIKQSAQKIYQNELSIKELNITHDFIILRDHWNIFSLTLSEFVKNHIEISIHKPLVVPHLQKLVAIEDVRLGIYTYDFKKVKEIACGVFDHIVDFTLSYNEKKVGYCSTSPYSFVVYDLEADNQPYNKTYSFENEGDDAYEKMRFGFAIHMASPEIASALKKFSFHS